MEYPFIAITPKFTPTWCVSTCMGQIDLLKNYLYSSRLLNIYTKNVNMNVIF